MSVDWNLDAYDFELPESLIAQQPAQQRDQSRLMLLHREQNSVAHHQFFELPKLLPKNCALVINNTKVLPARLLGQRESGGRIEGILVKEHQPGLWEVMLKRAKRIKPQDHLSFYEQRIGATAQERLDNGHWMLRFDDADNLMELLQEHAQMPLPPYIERNASSSEQNEQDQQRYQTCFAKNVGAIAAPTAGLHFTPEIIEQIKQQGTPVIEVTLHVGIGTFNPIRSSDIREHQMHSETYHFSEEAAAQLNQCLKEKRQIIAIGTTSVRVLESLPDTSTVEACSGQTQAYIYPPYRFKRVSGLLTNFHLAKSSLLLLVSAFYGREHLLNAYETAIKEEYRFFSYGDAMLIL